MIACPSYLFPLKRSHVTLETAFAESVAVFAKHPVPVHLCAQCLEPPLQQNIIATARRAHAGQTPDAISYASIYFEHPHCVGGEDTIKLFMPFGLRDFLTGLSPTGSFSYNYYNIVETTVQSGFWFWPIYQQAAVRQLALCLFWDWFEHGQYDWTSLDYETADRLGPGEDILNLCTLCLIDPYDLVSVLSGLHTTQADAALAGPLNFSVNACTYVAKDTSSEKSDYQDATAAIAETLKIREATAFVDIVTKAWVDAAYFRNETRAPELAKEISKFGQDYDVRILDTLDDAYSPLLEAWPNLEIID